MPTGTEDGARKSIGDVEGGRASNERQSLSLQAATSKRSSSSNNQPSNGKKASFASSQHDAMSDSAHAIFQASLSFENLHAMPPAPLVLNRNSSSASLHPTKDSISEAEIADTALEASWKNADRSSNSQKQPAVPTSAVARSSNSTRDSYIQPSSNGATNQAYKSETTASALSGVAAVAGNAPIGDYAYIPSERHSRNYSDEDADLIALKRAAYGGFNPTRETRRSASAPVHIPSTYTTPPQQAEATVVGFDIHPSEMIDANNVQAEFVCQDFSSEQMPSTSAIGDFGHLDEQEHQPIAASAAPSNIYHTVHDEPYHNSVATAVVGVADRYFTSVEAEPNLPSSSNEDITAEAVVIESGPMSDERGATAEAWNSSFHDEGLVLEEAQVLDDLATTPNVVDLDRKPPAVEQRTNDADVQSTGRVTTDEEAEVVGITEDLHPSEFIDTETRAELVTADINYAVAVEFSEQEQTELDFDGVAGVPVVGNSDVQDEDLHVVGICEEDLTQQAHSVQVLEETTYDRESRHSTQNNSTRAQLVELDHTVTLTGGYPPDINQETSYEVTEDAEPEVDRFGSSQAQLVDVADDSAPDACGVVVGISEEYHPSAVGANEARAELVEVEERTTDSIQVVGEAAEASSVAFLSNESLREQNHEAEVLTVPLSAVGIVEGSLDEFIQTEETLVEDGCAEVVDITEIYHPSELSTDEAQAEFVGTDEQVPDTFAVAQGQLESADLVGETHAMLVGQSYDGESNQPEHMVSVASISEAEAQEPLHVTTMMVVEVEQEDVEDDTDLDDPIKPGRPPRQAVARAISAPASTVADRVRTESIPSSVNMSYENSLSNGEDWTHRLSNNRIGEAIPMSPPLSVDRQDDGAPPIPARQNPVATTSTTSRASNRSDSSTGGSQRGSGLQILSTNIARGTNTMMETLFGDATPMSRRRNLVPAGFSKNSIAGSILPRTLLPSSVIYSQATKVWVATVNTNQKALDSNNVEEGSRSLRAFSVPAKKQALCLAKAWAPPRMNPFESNPHCFICETRFAVFRRACHCRNCGVCVCAQCTLQWPAKMLPDTYNIKRESFVNICKACDWLCTSFRLTLLDGDFDKAVAFHSTGNINLTTPFANVKGELFYPVHCAVIGGNLKLLKWLVDEHCCPLRSIRISNGKKKDMGSYTPILTSKGRSLLGIALGNRNVGLVRYLVVQKRMLLSAEKDLSIDTLVQNLDLVLRVLPEEVLSEQTLGNVDQGYQLPAVPNPPSMDRTTSNSTAPATAENSSSALDAALAAGITDNSSTEVVEDACIICFSNSIDCVVTPCGHQICCLECSTNISRCPVCTKECSFMRVFKP